MQRYIEACTRSADAARTEEILDRIITTPALHARFVNTLARMEYVGVRKLLKSRRAEVNYLMTTAAIEVRAQVFYPVYDRRLAAHRAGFSVAVITKDEDRHLADVGQSLARELADWQPRFERLMAAEGVLFRAFLDSVEAAAAVARAA